MNNPALQTGKIDSFLNRMIFTLTLLTLLDGAAKIAAPVGLLLLTGYVLGPATAAYPLLRLLFIISALFIAAYYFVKYSVFLYREPTRRDRVAGLLSARGGADGRRLLNAFELGRTEIIPPAGISAELAEAYRRQAESTIDYEGLGKSISTSHVLKSIASLLLIYGLLLGLYYRSPTGFGERQSDFFNFGTGKESFAPTSQQAKVEKKTPIVGDITLRYTYPEYTETLPRIENNSSGDISAIKGTVVDITAITSDPAKSAFMNMGEREIELKTEGRKISGQLTVTESGVYRFVIIDPKDEKFVDPIDHKIDALSDFSPHVEMIEPTEDLEANDLQVVRIIYKADDDFGLTGLNLVYRDVSIGGEEKRLAFPLDDNTPRETGGFYDWELSGLNLEPGSEVVYFLEAIDNDEVSGPKSSTSKSLRLIIKSALQEHQELLAAIERNQDQQINLLGDLLEEPVDSDIPDDRKASLSYSRTDQLDSIVKNWRAIEKDLREDVYSDKTAADGLAALASRQTPFLAKRRALVKSGSSASTLPSGTIKELGKLEIKETTEFEEAVLFIEQLLARERMGMITALMKELQNKQEELAELIRQAKEGGLSDEEKQALREQIARIERTIKDIAEQLAASRRTMPDEFINAAALEDKVTGRDLAGDLEKLKDALDSGDTDDILAKAEALMKQTAQMMSEMDESSAGFNKQAFGESAEKMKAAAKEISELRQKQQELIKETEKAEQEINSENAEKQKKLEEEFGKRIAQLLDHLDDLRNKMAAKLPGSYNLLLNLRYPITKLADSTRSLRSNVEGKKYKDAIENGYRVLENLDGLKKNADQARLKEMSEIGARDQIVGMATESEKAADEIVKMIEKMKQAPPMSEAMQQKMDKLAEKQNGLQDQLGGMRPKLEELAQGSPFVGGEIGESLEKAEGQMGEAGNDLAGNKPGRSGQSQRRADSFLQEAENGIEQAMEQMEQAQKSAQMNGQSSGGSPGGENSQRLANPSAEKVEIPGAEQFKSPEKYRREILEAIKEGGPSRFKDLNEAYYDRLIK